MRKVMFTMTVTYDDEIIDSESILQSIEQEFLTTKGVLFSESEVIFDKQINKKVETK